MHTLLKKKATEHTHSFYQGIWWLRDDPHNISPLFHTPLVFFSALLPGRSHNPPGLQRGKKRGMREEEGRDEKLQGGGMIGQTVCMCECAEIAQGKHKLAWELNHLSTVPLSKSPATSQLHVPSPLILSFCGINGTKTTMVAWWAFIFQVVPWAWYKYSVTYIPTKVLGTLMETVIYNSVTTTVIV